MKNKVFFNNSCNICRAEINHYKKHSSQDIEWVDVTNNKEAQKITSKSYEQLLRRMHIIQDGKLIEGLNKKVRIDNVLRLPETV